jgi:hypothetical protein
MRSRNYIANYPTHGLLPRNKMPQFETTEDVRQLDAAVRRRGKTVRNKSLDPERIRPMQRYVSRKKAMEIDPFTKGATRVLVSNDSKVIDGHHRWAALHWRNRKEGTRKRLKVRMYDMVGDDLLKLAMKVSPKRHTTFKTKLKT